MRDPAPDGAAPPARARGFSAALAAYFWWGLITLFFRALRPVPPLQILAHRVIWSMAFLALLVTWRRAWPQLGTAFRRHRLTTYLATTLLISSNWILFIWAVNSGRVLESSLGYYMNPLVNVLLGVVFLRERLTRWQTLAVGLAAAGVLALLLRLGTLPWVSLALAGTFGLYGLVRKKAGIDAILGLLVETALLAPVGLAYLALLARRGQPVFAPTGAGTALLLLSGVVTALPLIWFAVGMRSLRLSTMGLLQYVAPTIQFVLAVAFFGEAFTPAHGAAFALIWISLAVYSWDALRARRPEAEPQPVPLD